MLTKSMMTTMLPVTDMDRATRFYTEQLGLHQRMMGPDDSPIFDVGNGNGDAISLMSAEAGAQSKHTVLSFEVTDLANEIRDLESHGVRFEDYDLPGLKTVGHIAEMGDVRAAWFCDSEGNILCLHQMMHA